MFLVVFILALKELLWSDIRTTFGLTKVVLQDSVVEVMDYWMPLLVNFHFEMANVTLLRANAGIHYTFANYFRTRNWWVFCQLQLLILIWFALRVRRCSTDLKPFDWSNFLNPNLWLVFYSLYSSVTASGIFLLTVVFVFDLHFLFVCLASIVLYLPKLA